MAVGDKFFSVMENELAVSNGVATLGPDGLLNASQRPITDSMPTQGSSNPVQSGGVFSALSNKADKGPPQVYDLPLAEGVEIYADNVANYYCKNEFGEVSINTTLKIEIPLVSGMIIATMPQGFRRYDVISFPIIGYYSQNNNVFNGHITIEQTGAIRLWVRNIDQENSGASWISIPSAAYIATN